MVWIGALVERSHALAVWRSSIVATYGRNMCAKNDTSLNRGLCNEERFAISRRYCFDEISIRYWMAAGFYLHGLVLSIICECVFVCFHSCSLRFHNVIIFRNILLMCVCALVWGVCGKLIVNQLSTLFANVHAHIHRFRHSVYISHRRHVNPNRSYPRVHVHVCLIVYELS